MPLLDAAPLIIAAEMGFAAEEGLELALHREMSWAALRDRLIWGRYDAAHMLAPVVDRPDRRARRRRRGRRRADGAVGQRRHGRRGPALAGAMGAGGRTSSTPPPPAGRSPPPPRGGRCASASPSRSRCTQRSSTTGSRAAALAGALTLVTVPPPRMAAAMAAGEIDAFCVGEPWGSVAVEIGAAELILPGAAIWQFAPEKVLARAATEPPRPSPSAPRRCCARPGGRRAGSATPPMP